MSYKPAMLLATVDMLPGAQYQVLGLVSGDTRTISGNAKLDGALKDMEAEAKKMGGQAIIGIRATIAPTNGLVGVQMFTLVTGTVIKFT